MTKPINSFLSICFKNIFLSAPAVFSSCSHSRYLKKFGEDHEVALLKDMTSQVT